MGYDLVEDRVKKLNQSKGGIDIPSLIKITNSGVTVPDNVKNVSGFCQFSAKICLQHAPVFLTRKQSRLLRRTSRQVTVSWAFSYPLTGGKDDSGTEEHTSIVH